MLGLLLYKSSSYLRMTSSEPCGRTCVLVIAAVSLWSAFESNKSNHVLSANIVVLLFAAPSRAHSTICASLAWPSSEQRQDFIPFQWRPIRKRWRLSKSVMMRASLALAQMDNAHLAMPTLVLRSLIDAPASMDSGKLLTVSWVWKVLQ